MRILGIDPGLSVTGYGLIEAEQRKFKLIEAGLIRTSPKDRIQNRLFKIYDGLAELIDEYQPSVLVLEKLYAHYKHPTTALLMGHARGIICFICGQKKIPLVSYPATRIKKAVVGRGHAPKEQVGGMIKNLLGLKKTPESNDITDALAIAISHAYQIRPRLMERSEYKSLAEFGPALSASEKLHKVRKGGVNSHIRRRKFRGGRLTKINDFRKSSAHS